MNRIMRPVKLRMVCVAVLAVILLISQHGIGVMRALATEPSPHLTVDEVIASAGENVSVDVRVADNPGIMGATLVIDYDPQLALTGVRNGVAFEGLDMTKPGELKPGCRIHWDAADIGDDAVTDGTVVTLQFTIPSGAVAGTEYAISVVPSTSNGKPDVFDRELNVVDLVSVSSCITVRTDAPPHVHSYGGWRVVQQATCTSNGHRVKTCVDGDDTIEETIDALGHLWGVAVVTKEASVGSPGERTWTCERCGEMRTEEFTIEREGAPMLLMGDTEATPGSQVSVEVSIVRNPGITDAALVVSYDSDLVLSGVSNGEAFSTLNMSSPEGLNSGCYIKWGSENNEAVGMGDGVVATLLFDVPVDISEEKQYRVNIGARTSNGKIDVFDWANNAVDLNPASCMIRVAPEMSDHVHAYGEWSIVQSASCTEYGLREKVCSGCGDKVTEDIPALGHSWDSGEVIKAATYDSAGIRVFTCERCGETRTEEIAKLARISLEDATIDAIADVWYSGSALEPAPVVRLSGRVLEPGTDYEVSYANNAEIGRATVTVTGKGAYAGTKSTTFSIIEGAIGLAKGESATAGTGSSEAKYTATGASTVTFASTAAKGSKSVVVPDTVVINGKAYRVTKVADNAFKGAKATGITLGANVAEIGAKTFSGAAKVKTVTVGKGVKKIAAKSFAGNKSLRTVVVKTTKLAKKSAVKNCLKGSKVAKVQVKVGTKAQNKKYAKTYKKLFAGKKPVAGKRVIVR